jgi:hypothetical protein
VQNPTVFSQQQAIDLASVNVEALLGLSADTSTSVSSSGAGRSWVAWEGDFFGYDSRVRAVRAEGRQVIDLF